MFVRKYTSTRAFQIPIKLGVVKAQALIDTGANAPYCPQASLNALAQASVSISPHCQQWETSTIFPTTTATIPDMIVQLLPTNSVTAELPIETAMVNPINGQCRLLFVNNMPNSIKLRPNQLITVAKQVLRPTKYTTHCQVATTAMDHDLTDHEPPALDKSLSCHKNQQKLDFALNKMTAKTYISTAQKAKAFRML
uniref:Peptidase A2 domain-containing protein n=1 Tax=Romanomermis culicivorax TaxID=13658 RepID=A0A915I6R0_ROMCU